MPADRPNIGTGARRQGATEPDRSDDRNRQLERELEQETRRAAAGAKDQRGRQPGAHGNDAPHRNVKPGTRDALESMPERDS
jgi:hypothetical protein